MPKRVDSTRNVLRIDAESKRVPALLYAHAALRMAAQGISPGPWGKWTLQAWAKGTRQERSHAEAC